MFEQVAESFSKAKLARDSQNPEILAILRSLTCKTPDNCPPTPIPKIDIFDSTASYDFPQIEDFEEDEDGEMAYSGTTETKEINQAEEINNAKEISAKRHASERVSRNLFSQ